MIERLRAALQRDTQAEQIHECRDCGRTLNTARSRCPECQSTEIAAYEL